MNPVVQAHGWKQREQLIARNWHQRLPKEIRIVPASDLRATNCEQCLRSAPTLTCTWELPGYLQRPAHLSITISVPQRQSIHRLQKSKSQTSLAIIKPVYLLLRRSPKSCSVNSRANRTLSSSTSSVDDAVVNRVTLLILGLAVWSLRPNSADTLCGVLFREAGVVRRELTGILGCRSACSITSLLSKVIVSEASGRRSTGCRCRGVCLRSWGLSDLTVTSELC